MTARELFEGCLILDPLEDVKKKPEYGPVGGKCGKAICDYRTFACRFDCKSSSRT